MTLDAISVVLCDLDGVVWLAHRPVPGSVDALARLRATGRQVLFVTNNSASTRAQHEAALAALGIDAHGDVVSSSMAAGRLLTAGERVLVCGGDGVREAVTEAGADLVDGDDPASADAVVVGLDRSFDYEKLHRASAAVRSGARFIATNDDATYPTPAGPTPGGGAMVAAIATAAGRAPVVAGKPHRPMADLVRFLVGDVPSDRILMVGDRPSTDGHFATALGARFALVHSGVTGGDDAVDGVDLDLRVDDLAAVVDAVLDGTDPDPSRR